MAALELPRLRRSAVTESARNRSRLALGSDPGRFTVVGARGYAPAPPIVGGMRFFRRKQTQAPPDVEHAVITHLPLSGADFGSGEEREAVYELEARIETAVAAVGGEHDGNEFGAGEAILYTYGPDADAVFDAIRECLGGFPVRPGAYAIKRYGAADDPAARQERVSLA